MEYFDLQRFPAAVCGGPIAGGISRNSRGTTCGVEAIGTSTSAVEIYIYLY
jgi:hypothetical protein